VPKTVTSVDVYNGGTTSSNVTVACAGQLSRQVSVAPNQKLTLSTNWTGNCTTVTISSSNIPRNEGSHCIESRTSRFGRNETPRKLGMTVCLGMTGLPRYGALSGMPCRRRLRRVSSAARLGPSIRS
jgi:hypothetical protein